MDELLPTLGCSVRRDLIRFFENRSTGTTASLEELVAHLLRRASTKPGDGLWKTLHQVHLPTLHSRGWLEFDTDSEQVTYHGHEEAEQLLGDLHDMFKP